LEVVGAPLLTAGRGEVRVRVLASLSRNARPGGLLLALRAGPSLCGQVAEKALMERLGAKPERT